MVRTMRLPPPAEVQARLDTFLGEEGELPKTTHARRHHRTSGLFSALGVGGHVSLTPSRFITQSMSRKIDATRSDGLSVHLHLISEKKFPEATDVMLHLTSDKLDGDDDGGNHTVPVLEVLEVDDSGDLCIFVTPLMRACDDPWFENVGEVVDFLGQVLEVGVPFVPLSLLGPHCFSIFREWNSCMPTDVRLWSLKPIRLG